MAVQSAVCDARSAAQRCWRWRMATVQAKHSSSLLLDIYHTQLTSSSSASLTVSLLQHFFAIPFYTSMTGGVDMPSIVPLFLRVTIFSPAHKAHYCITVTLNLTVCSSQVEHNCPSDFATTLSAASVSIRIGEQSFSLGLTYCGCRCVSSLAKSNAHPRAAEQYNQSLDLQIIHVIGLRRPTNRTTTPHRLATLGVIRGHPLSTLLLSLLGLRGY
ncbi:hypothetical protein EGR_07598 [Echinococcus granulosus]|uniref:Uncharacterized protein n=1 Tax=Echinococcus granulosus TaxID=6210 RepID=W6UHF3_ECHGR|nr:hypothetical protein EGR_07598 [Echinococcus granulosus]EUB57507.1 hypothetical protein EGR_07598 [Echinococcus granulosus]